MDEWATWLLRGRDGGDESIRRRFAPQLLAFRDGVLDRACIEAGDTVLDVGTGTGLLGRGALDRIGDSGRVIFSDVSADLLRECRAATGDDSRCEFVQAAADDLSALADASVDVVTTRSVLIYVENKAAAFAEMRRVLRPGGRLSVFEPINSFPGTSTALPFTATGPVAALAQKVLRAYPRISAMQDFDERDLLQAARDAGFTAITMDYRAEVDVPAPAPERWQALKHTAPNPLAPTYAEAMAAVLTPQEIAVLDAYVEKAVTDARPVRRTSASVYLRAEV